MAEEGECVICVEKRSGSGRYDRIVRMIEESEKLKSTAEDKAARLADRLVPYTLGGTALTYLLTRSITKTLAVLMVDFSCALKLAIPIAVLSAMRESSGHHISVKGGRFLESVAKADTIVFDKTGTLTYAAPTVAQVVPFGGHSETDMLRLAACLEEHYPHSMANAVVEEAKRRGLHHEEYHSRWSMWWPTAFPARSRAKRSSSAAPTSSLRTRAAASPRAKRPLCRPAGEYSHLYLHRRRAGAVICISDPLRARQADVVRRCTACGIRNVVMMTGDNRKTAAAVARRSAWTNSRRGRFRRTRPPISVRTRRRRDTVIMVGDGVNDSPALSEADAGIAISTGAAIAREIADITIASEDLFELVDAAPARSGADGAHPPQLPLHRRLQLTLIGWAWRVSCRLPPRRCCTTCPPWASACGA